VTRAPTFPPSTLNWTLATATSSDAFAARFTVPDNVAPATGEVMETVGGVVSLGDDVFVPPLTKPEQPTRPMLKVATISRRMN
jgi:hypothetical protein